MRRIESKLSKLFRDRGFIGAVGRVAVYVVNRRRFRKMESHLAALDSPEEKFTWIYENRFWSAETPSGQGSTLAYTSNLRKELPALLEKYAIARIFDAPCGDFSWMHHLLSVVEVEYVGGDIVRPLVESLSGQYGDGKASFLHIDLVTEAMPNSDLMICRDCLFHLSFQDARAVLENFVESGTPYLLTTTHKNTGHFANVDIETGGFRLLDLFSFPFNFPAGPLASIDDWAPPDPEREMCLFNRQQVTEALQNFGRSV